MKLLYTTIGLFLSLSSFAQMNLQQTTNINQIVSNIFGLNCEDIGSVTLIGSPYSAGYFTNGGYVGMNSGLVMSTGIFMESTMPGGYFNSQNMTQPGDAEIDAIDPTFTSYDAVSIQFDFNPTVTDTISFKYIFASEEYPEYVNQGYNDRFLFLVSENGGSYVNVAKVPNTSSPVEINSINLGMNAQYYVDNMNGSGNPNFQSWVYDGYTVPLFAKFFVQAGNSYHIKLVIADVNDGIFNSAIFLDEQNSFSNISGDLTIAGSAAQDGVIEVFDAAQDSTVASILYSVPVVNGQYSIDSIVGGNYHIRYLPDLNSNPNALPAYFTSGSTWADATLISLPCFLNGADVNAPSVTLTGAGSIGGTIYIDSSFQKSMPLPCANAVVLLKNMTTNEFVDYTRSNSVGQYSFENLPFGDYLVQLDVPYMPMLDSVIVSVSATHLHGGNIDHSIETDGIHSELSVLGLTENELQFSIQPNPAKGDVTVKGENLMGMDVQIFQLNGQLVLSQKIESNTQKLSIQSLESGIYFMKVGNSKTKKLTVMN